MKTFKINAQGIGAAIGLLLVNGIVYLIFHRTPASEEEINAYIQNSEVVELTDFTFFDVEDMVRYARQSIKTLRHRYADGRCRPHHRGLHRPATG